MSLGALPHDAALPQLGRALDAQAMAPVLGALLPGLQVLGCEVQRVKYRPQRNCSLVYALRLRREGAGAEFEQAVAARLCSDGSAARRHRQAAALAGAPSAAGPRTSHLPALDMVLHWLPHDPRLPALPLLADPQALRRQALPPVLAALGLADSEPIAVDCTIAQLVPELRVCARVELRRHGAAPQVLYAKAGAGFDGAALHAVMQALADSPAQRRGALHTARPLLWDAATGLHWQHAVPGLALHRLQEQPGAALSARVGRALAELHATPLPGLVPTGAEDLRRRVQDAAALLAAVDPAWRTLLERLAARLLAGAARVAAEPAASLHGDLHPRNIMVEGERLAFIDLDAVHAGPAVLELGAWIGDTLYRALLEDTPPQATVPACRAFLAAHAQHGGRAADPALLAWSVAFDLFAKRAGRCVAGLKPGRFERVPRLLALADAVAAPGGLQAVLPRLLPQERETA